MKTPRCPKCGAGTTCPRCNGRIGGRASGEAKRLSSAKARAARYTWTVGELVQPRVRRHRTWRGAITKIGQGVPGRRELTIRVYRSELGSPAGSTAVVARESSVVRVRE